MKGDNHVNGEKRKSLTPLWKQKILEACRTESSDLFKIFNSGRTHSKSVRCIEKRPFPKGGNRVVVQVMYVIISHPSDLAL